MNTVTTTLTIFRCADCPLFCKDNDGKVTRQYCDHPYAQTKRVGQPLGRPDYCPLKVADFTITTDRKN